MKVLAWPADWTPEMNPYTRLLYRHIRAVQSEIEVGEFSTRAFFRDGGRWDVWHLHWPDALVSIRNPWRMAAELIHFIVLAELARVRRVRLVWTIHDLQTHARVRPRLEELFKRWLISRLDGAITLTPGGAAAARALYPGLAEKPMATIPHGHFMDAYPNTTSREGARERLGLPPKARVLLFFGTIRPYKNVLDLIRTVGGLEDPDLRLLIAGLPESVHLRCEIEIGARQDPRIQLHLNAIAPTDVQLFMNAADLVVLPFRQIQNSGSVILALSFLRPVLAPATGAIPELQRLVGEDVLMTYSGQLSAAHLRESLGCVQAGAGANDHVVSTLRAKLGWESIAKATVDFYRRVITQSS